MLHIVGIGLKPRHISLEALETLKECEKIYLESYTSEYSSGSRDNLEDLLGKAVTGLDRKQVEEEFGAVLEEAKTKKIGLAVFGNPMNATTHIQILLDAKELGVKTQVIPGMSVFEFVAFTGLDRYKFGRTTSIVFHDEDYEPESFYDAILENKKHGLHTLCLLDIKKEQDKMMNVHHAISLLERIEEKREKSVLSESIMIGLAGLGSNNEQIKAAPMEELKKFVFTQFPQSLIICGKLNEKEIEALRELSGLSG